MSAPKRDAIQEGLRAAQVSLQLVGRHLDDPGDQGQTLSDLSALIGHVSTTQDGWRAAVAYLAAQVRIERRTSDAAYARDMETALSLIRRQIEWMDKLHPRDRS